ncbi:MAG: hypothetical protein AB7O96_02240 [Pseudobdellovibrionaceae bacterium]
MKKFLMIALAISFAVPALAHRSYRRGHHHHHGHTDGDVAVASSAGLALGLSTASAANRLQIAVIQEDAAIFLAGNEMTAALQEAIGQMKIVNPDLATASDEELAAALLQ